MWVCEIQKWNSSFYEASLRSIYSKMNPPVKLREQVTRQNLRKEFRYTAIQGLGFWNPSPEKGQHVFELGMQLFEV